MYILKNAWLAIIRNKGRNILIGLIILIISFAATIALAINSSAKKLVTSYEEKYNIEATISFNRENLMKNFTPGSENNEENINKFNSVESITIDDINNYGDSKYVDYYYYTSSVGMDGSNISPATDELQKITTDTTTTTKSYSSGNFPGMGSKEESVTTTKRVEEIVNMRGSNGDFTLIGYSSYEGMSDFISGSYTITEGSVSEDFTSYTCVINSELASLNELSVGDTITLLNADDNSYSYTLTITGIFEDSSEESNNMKSMFTSSANKIITNTTVINKILEEKSDTSVTITPTFVLKNKNVVDKFASEVEEKGLADNYQVTNNLEEVEKETKSIYNLSSFATTFLIVILIIGGLVLFIINMLNVRERKYEIGVLRTIGMSKTKVILKFTEEICIVALVGLMLGALIGSLSSVSISNSLLASEIESSLEENNKIRENFGGMGMMPQNNDSNQDESGSSSVISENSKEEKIINGMMNLNQVSEINAVVNLPVLLELLAIGLGLVLVSSLASMISIARFSPLSILKERS